jgi:hypothetical protein
VTHIFGVVGNHNAATLLSVTSCTLETKHVINITICLNQPLPVQGCTDLQITSYYPMYLSPDNYFYCSYITITALYIAQTCNICLVIFMYIYTLRLILILTFSMTKSVYCVQENQPMLL